MGWLLRQPGLPLLSCIFFYLSLVSAESRAAPENATEKGNIFVDRETLIAKIDDDFICATLDWWPPEKCDYGKCSWGQASLLNLDLTNKIFSNAVKAFSPLKIRLGGTLQDRVIYEEEGRPCTPFSRNASEMFGFTQGCLPMKRWDALNAFFRETGAKVIFGLNALAGRLENVSLPWNSSNAEAFIKYTVSKNYTIHGWELGNELGGSGVGMTIPPDQYASDTKALNSILVQIYRKNKLTIAPGSFFKKDWFQEFIDKTKAALDVVTHHIYNLGPGNDPNLSHKILDPSYLDDEADTYRNLRSIIRASGTSAVAWVGEAGGAYNSGHDGVSNTFLYSFWYLDQLGMASSYDTKTYCRQSLVGGNYGLLDTTTFVPNPDYYSALLFHRLMGKGVLSATYSGTKKLRVYAHCAKKPDKGIALLLINLDRNTTIKAAVQLNGTLSHPHKQNHKKKAIWLPRGSKIGMQREEYHLTAMDWNLHNRTVLLNGNILNVSSNGDIPTLTSIHRNISELITIRPLSIVFVRMFSNIPACT